MQTLFSVCLHSSVALHDSTVFQTILLEHSVEGESCLFHCYVILSLLAKFRLQNSLQLRKPSPILEAVVLRNE